VLVTCELSTIAPPETPRLNKGVCHFLPSSASAAQRVVHRQPGRGRAVGTAQTPGESALSPPAFTAVTAANTAAPLVSAVSVAPGAATLVFVLPVVTGAVDELYTL